MRDSRPAVSRPTVSRGGGTIVSGSAGGEPIVRWSAGGDSIGSSETLPVEDYGDEVLLPALRAVADPAELAAAARLLQDRSPSLAALLWRAAGPGQEIDAES